MPTIKDLVRWHLIQNTEVNTPWSLQASAGNQLCAKNFPINRLLTRRYVKKQGKFPRTIRKLLEMQTGHLVHDINLRKKRDGFASRVVNKRIVFHYLKVNHI